MKKTIDGVTITGNEHWLEIQTDVPESEEEDCRSYFVFRGNKYFLDEIMNLHNKVYCVNPPKFMEGFDGYDDHILIKLHASGDAVKAYNFY
jgi:hypothetical protein